MCRYITDSEKLNTFDSSESELTNKQAIEYIDSLIQCYETRVIQADTHNKNYRLCEICLGENDIKALEMAKEALRKEE